MRLPSFTDADLNARIAARIETLAANQRLARSRRAAVPIAHTRLGAVQALVLALLRLEALTLLQVVARLGAGAAGPMVTTLAGLAARGLIEPDGDAWRAVAPEKQRARR